jgi:WD40 repeat protein/serine/threonine protein kinase
MDQDASPFARPPASADTTAAPLKADIPVSIPDHELLRCIGRGSYGSVWLARNMMGMFRAVKIVFRKSFDNQRPFERELSGIRKFEPISRLHEGFVDVLHVGINEEQGYFYYVMELGDDQVSGQNIDTERYNPKTLAKQISLHGRIPLEECLQLGMGLSKALAELHKNGLVHRDVKPSNIIFVNGLPKLADIGLVADVNEARSYVGTEGFIPPEGPGTPQADVYGLGKVLYEASTGKDRQEFPELPTQLDRLPDHEIFLELNEVILQACKNDIKGRYQSAGELHAELVVVTNGESIKRLRTLERLLSNLKRVGVVSGIVVLLAGAVFYHLYQERKRAADKLQQLVGESVGYGTRAVESEDFISGLRYFSEALWLDRGVEERQVLHRLRFGSTLAQCPKLLRVWWREGHMECVDISSDGRRLLMARMSPPRAEVVDLETGEQLGQFAHTDSIRSAVFHPEGKLVATASVDKTACIWNARDGTVVATLPHPEMLYCARFSPDGSKLVTAGEHGLVWVWDWRSGTKLRELRFHTNALQFAGFSPDGSRIVTGGKDCLAQLWNAATGEKIGRPLPHANWVRYAAFSPDGRTLVTAAQDDKAHVWDISTERARPVPPDLAHSDRMGTVEFAPDGRLLVTASLDGTARIWFLNTHQLLKPVGILRHSSRVSSAVFAPDGHRILTSCVDGTVRLWDLADEILPPQAPQLYSPDGTRFLATTTNGWVVHDAASGQSISPAILPNSTFTKTNLSRNGDFIVALSVLATNEALPAGQWQVWETASGKTVGPAIPVSDVSAKPVLSPDGNYLVTFTNAEAQQWDVRRGVPTSLSHPELISSACFSGDSSWLALYGANRVSVWRTRTSTQAYEPLTHRLNVTYADFSPDGSRLVTCQAEMFYEHCPACVWDTATGKLKFQVEHGDGVVFVAFNSDGTRMVTCGEDSKAIVWNALTGELIASMKHDNQVRTARFSPDNKWIVTASWDSTARVWSAETGQPLTPPLRHLAQLRGASFLSDGRRILTTEWYGAERVWELPVDPSPVEDLLRFANLLSGERILAGGKTGSTKPESVQAAWEDLRTRYPSAFAVDSRSIELWHKFQAVQCMQEQQLSAAEFHLKRLLELHPGDRAVESRLAAVREQLAQELRPD